METKTETKAKKDNSFKKIIRAAMSIIAIAECDDDCFADDFCKEDYTKCIDIINENLDAIDAEVKKAKEMMK